MTADNDIVERLRALSRCEHSDLSVGDEAAAEIVRLRGEADALHQCGIKYLGWLGVKDAENGLRKDMADPEMVDRPAPAMPNGVEGLMQLARNWCLAWGEWAHDADPGGAKENAAEAALRAALTTALAQQPAADGGFTAADMMDARQEGRKEAQQPAAHPDDAAVDAFAAAMKEKLAASRAKGRGGWNGDEPGMQQRLSDMLRTHVEKGDPRDVANFAMFLHQRGEAILPVQQPAPSAPVGATLTNPWTGEPRDYRDVNSDPAGVLCVEPGAPLKAAPDPEGLTVKQAWWAGYRAGKSLPPETPRNAALAQQPAARRQYYSKVNGCPANGAHEPGCICWRVLTTQPGGSDNE